MKPYIGTHTVMAEPMNEKEASEALGRLSDSNSENRHGYLVEHPDGYRTWMLKEVFEQYYKIAETRLDRLRIERDNLMEKLQRLNIFLFSEKSMDIPCRERSALTTQKHEMEGYLETLCRRIEFAVRDAATAENKEGCNHSNPDASFLGANPGTPVPDVYKR